MVSKLELGGLVRKSSDYNILYHFRMEVGWWMCNQSTHVVSQRDGIQEFIQVVRAL